MTIRTPVHLHRQPTKRAIVDEGVRAAARAQKAKRAARRREGKARYE